MTLSKTYAALFALQTLILQSIAVIGPPVNSAACFVIMFICGYLRVLQNRLLLMPHNLECNDDAYDIIKNHVKLHQKILR